jgi:hypothetical protein
MHVMQPPSRFPISGRMLLGAVMMSMVLSGCAGAPGGETYSPEAAEVVEGYDCLAPNLSAWVQRPDTMHSPDPRHPDAPEAGRVPDGFTPARAVRCDQSDSIDDAEGRWSGVTAVTLTGDLTALLAALAEPDDAAGGGPCTADMEIVSPLWLVDGSGQAILAHYPRDKCAKTKPAVHDALARLSVEGTTVLKRTLEVPRRRLFPSRLGYRSRSRQPIPPPVPSGRYQLHLRHWPTAS